MSMVESNNCQSLQGTGVDILYARIHPKPLFRLRTNNDGLKNEPETLMPRRSKDDGNSGTSEETFYAQQNCFYQSANHVFKI